jgi:hypothetical protein
VQDVEPLERLGSEFTVGVVGVLCEPCEPVGGDTHESYMVNGLEIGY